MSTTTAVRPPARAALSALIDYAGLFPPAKLGMADAASEYAGARGGPHAWLLGRFIVPASRVAELGELASRFALSVIVDADADPRRWFDSARGVLADLARLRAAGARAEAIEVPLPRLLTRRETYDAAIGQLGALLSGTGLRDLPVYAEIPRDARWVELLPGSMAACARAGIGAKLRCGGVTAQAFPAVEEVAAFIGAAASARAAFKATAGLHHPVRHADAATGFPMHGFLNLLAAAAFAGGVERETLLQIVAEEDPAAFVFDEMSLRWRGLECDAAGLAAMRERGFAAYGSCSFAEPVEDLAGLGVIPAA